MKLPRMICRGGALILIGWTVQLSAAVSIYSGGEARLPVLISNHATAIERDAAADLTRCLQKMSGLAWPEKHGDAFDEPGFYLGAGIQRGAATVEVKSSSLPNLAQPDRFRISATADRIVFEGATPEARAGAVWWFLRHPGGVRWYAPGEEGEQISLRSDWSVLERTVEFTPPFISTELTGLDSPDEQLWARRNGLHRRLEPGHALDRLIPVEQMRAHPTWQPWWMGRRRLPEPGAAAAWQPNMADPELANFAAQAARAAWSASPEQLGFSVGINDSVRFDQSDATRVLVSPLRFFRGLPDYSPLVFTFVNRVAATLKDVDSGRRLNCLAYYWCENPPPFPVEPRVFPFVTSDRGEYYDQSYRTEDCLLLEHWGRSGASGFGLWEYAYGAGYLIPRQPLQAFAAAIREGSERGARAYLGEVMPHAGFDAFKLWMLAALLEQPDRSVEELAADFFPGYFGDAAPPLRKFFETCEEIWMRQVGGGQWLKLYYQEDQALLFSEPVCRELRGLLETGRGLARDPRVARRVERVSRAFAVTEALAALTQARRDLAEMQIDRRSKPAEIGGAIRRWVIARAELMSVFERARHTPDAAMSAMPLTTFLRNDPIPRLLLKAGETDQSWPMAILKSADLAASEVESWRQLADILGGGTTGPTVEQLRNGSFAEVAAVGKQPPFLYRRFGSQPADWTVDAMPTENGKVAIVTQADGAQPASRLRIEGARDTMVSQWVVAEPGAMYCATLLARGRSSPGNEAALYLRFQSVSGQAVGSVAMHSLKKGQVTEDEPLVVAAMAPADAAWVGVGVGVTRQDRPDWLEVSQASLRRMNQR